MKKKATLSIKDYTIGLIYLGLILILFIYSFWPLRVQGKSMENTLQNNDCIIVSKLVTWISGYRYEDLVVLDYDASGTQEKIVKRIVGLEGDHIVIKNNKLYRNEELITENYIKNSTDGTEEIIVPKNCLYVLGDNRKQSKDSRIMGCFETRAVRGKVILRVYPLHRLYSFVKNY